MVLPLPALPKTAEKMPERNGGGTWVQKNNTSKIHDSHPGVFLQPTNGKVVENQTPCSGRVPCSCICPRLHGMEWRVPKVSNNTNKDERMTLVMIQITGPRNEVLFGTVRVELQELQTQRLAEGPEGSG